MPEEEQNYGARALEVFMLQIDFVPCEKQLPKHMLWLRAIFNYLPGLLLPLTKSQSLFLGRNIQQHGGEVGGRTLAKVLPLHQLLAPSLTQWGRFGLWKFNLIAIWNRLGIVKQKYTPLPPFTLPSSSLRSGTTGTGCVQHGAAHPLFSWTPLQQPARISAPAPSRYI